MKEHPEEEEEEEEQARKQAEEKAILPVLAHIPPTYTLRLFSAPLICPPVTSNHFVS